MNEKSELFRLEGKTISFVPTMGFLHEGHLSLMRKGKEIGNILVVSIFVNPAQFGPSEDFDKYPKDIEKDFDLAEKLGVDIVFTPDKEVLYPKGYQTYVKLEQLPDYLCGISRPSFFKGVATVVTKLFNIVKPHFAIFGEKDYQQLVVIKQMVCDLNFNIKIIGAPTIREPDGLAMSSRNAYLTSIQRESALSLYKALNKAQKLVKNKITDTAKIIEAASELINSYPETQIDYISVFNPKTLEQVEHIKGPSRMALAVKIGETRLIDNMQLNP